MHPARDDKVLADWNGLMIASLAEAGAVFGEPEWMAAASTAFDFVAGKLSKGSRLRHSYRLGEARHAATLDDHACMIKAALALFETTGESAYLEKAERWTETAERHFWDQANGGYFLTADDTTDVIARTKSAMDQAVPSGNGVMTANLARLFHLTGNDRYRERAQSVIAAFSANAGETFHAMPTLLSAQDILENAVEIVIVGARGADDTAALLRAAYALSLPNRVLRIVSPEAELPATHAAAGRGQVDAKATAYVCRAQTCSLPVTGAAELAALLTAR